MKDEPPTAWPWVIAAVVFFILVMACLGGPNFIALKHRVRMTEAGRMVDEIRRAELEYFERHLEYVPVIEPTPRSIETLDAASVDWPSGTPFNQIGWRPDGPVRGTFTVRLAPHGFVVEGWSDADGDGWIEHFRATESETVFRVDGGPPD